jgi:RNA polymerase sigma-70 factor (ECF subfamily)
LPQEAAVFDEASLVAQARQGDTTAFNELTERYQRNIFRLAQNITQNREDAEDVLQTVFLRLVKRDPDADPVTNLPSFLHRAAVNAALDLVRAKQNVRNIPLDELEWRFNNRKNEFIFRDTLTKLVNAAKLPYSELTKSA